MNSIINSIKMLLIMIIIVGILYPLLITGIGHLFFNKQATGSISFINKKPVGSELIGQNFVEERYFHGRPSACSYNPIAAGASNKSVTNREYNELVTNRYNELSKLYNTKDIPQELYTASGSGLDPHISKKAVFIQFDRVALARKMNSKEKEKMSKLIDKIVEGRDFGIFGEERVNILKLNIMIDLYFNK